MHKFAASIKEAVYKNAKAAGILAPDAVIAQACLESGYGTSGLAKQAHNLFGMKCGKSWKGDKYRVRTREVYNGKSVYVYADFRKYKTDAACIKDYFSFINTKRYANLKGVKNVKKYLQLIQKDGWATDPKYATSCYSVYLNQVKE